MQSRVAVSALALTLAIASPARAQDVIGLASPQEAQQHLQTATAPVYPRIAQAANVEGRVLVILMVGPDGRVQQDRIVRSVVMLDGAVDRAVTTWTFQPFVIDGHPVSEQVPVLFSFAVGHAPTASFPDDYVAIAGPIAPCEAALMRNAFATAVTLCDAALQAAQQSALPRNGAAWQQARAGWRLAQALVGLGRVPEALPRFDRAIEDMPKEVRAPTADDRVHLLLDAAHAYEAATNEPRAVTLYHEAADMLGKMHDVAPPTASLTAELKAALLEEADALDKVGRANDADDCRERAAKLE